MLQLEPDQQKNIYTVSRLNREARTLMEGAFEQIWIEGEISNFIAPQSGHWYFSLKDKSAQIRCALFKSHQRKLGFTPKDGMYVLMRARASLYENRGDFQLIADFLEERGEGKLRRAFELLKKKLEGAGLFDIQHKKTLPSYPRQIGIITSATGAALRDILHVLKRRASHIPIIIYPTLVQGTSAAPTIVRSIQLANERKECDLLLLARGGGSLEDLWPFNEEIVAHAIFHSQIPIISGIGHEIDFTIADFVADVRAPTPSAAAEVAAASNEECIRLLNRQLITLSHSIKNKLAHANEKLTWAHKGIRQLHPQQRLQQQIQLLDRLELDLVKRQSLFHQKIETQLKMYMSKLQRVTPTYKIQSSTVTLEHHLHHLIQAIMKISRQKSNHLVQAAAKLDTLSPLATLKRGYAIVTDEAGEIIKHADSLKPQQHINVRLEKTNIQCLVKEILETT